MGEVIAIDEQGRACGLEIKNVDVQSVGGRKGRAVLKITHKFTRKKKNA